MLRCDVDGDACFVGVMRVCGGVDVCVVGVCRVALRGGGDMYVRVGVRDGVLGVMMMRVDACIGVLKLCSDA